MKLVIKIGGTLIQEQDSRELLALQVGRLVDSGNRVLVVHGGGAQLTAFLKTAGIEAEFVEGRRVTSPQVLDAAIKVAEALVSLKVTQSKRTYPYPPVKEVTGYDQVQRPTPVAAPSAIASPAVKIPA